MAMTRPTQLVFMTSPNGTYSSYVKVTAGCVVSLSVWGTFNSATVTFWKSNDNGSTWHAIRPSTDPTTPLTGAAFTVSAALDTSFRTEPCLLRWVIASGGGSESINLAFGGRSVRGNAGGTT